MAVNIAYASSERYKRCTGVSMISLLENNRDIEDMKIYLFTTDMDKESRLQLKNMVLGYNRELIIIDIRIEIEALGREFNLPTLNNNYNTYIRLFFSKWLEFLDRILFIDADTLVVGSIIDLYTSNMGEHLILAVPDAGVYGKNEFYENQEIINMGDKYFNAGIVLINLQEWRKENINILISEKIKKHTGKWINQEQSILNFTLYNRCKYAHLKYNYYSLFHLDSYEELCKNIYLERVFDRNEYEEATKNPIIIHFVGASYMRPWFNGNISPYRGIYMSYYKLSPWKDLPLEEFPKQKQIGYRLYDYLLYITLKKRWKKLHDLIKKIFGEEFKIVLRKFIGARK